MLHACVYWPKEGTVLDLVNSVERYITTDLTQSVVYLVFKDIFFKALSLTPD